MSSSHARYSREPGLGVWRFHLLCLDRLHRKIASNCVAPATPNIRSPCPVQPPVTSRDGPTFKNVSKCLNKERIKYAFKILETFEIEC